MSEVFLIDPNDVPLDEYPEWQAILVGITDKGLNWIEYGVNNTLYLLVYRILGKYNIHVSERGGFHTLEMKSTKISTLAELKVMALKVMVAS
ncbi:hypothetical protein [Acinetobacter sp. A47]|uniref:hypothetical protein n=1 Tax=Acinetobacter sp. A47 TaxID=1561217 RepID=UPI000570BC19|nr:hypothetical protein [Acinetobacter sp. A47]